MNEEKCKFCGSAIKTSDWVCPKCGYTQWNVIIIAGIVSLFCLISAFVWISKWETFACLKWPVAILSALVFLVCASEAIKGVQMIGKHNIYKEKLANNPNEIGDTVQPPATNLQPGLSTKVIENIHPASADTIKCPSCGTTFVLPKIIFVPQEIIDKYGQDIIQCPSCKFVWQRESPKKPLTSTLVNQTDVEEDSSLFGFSSGVINSYSGNLKSIAIPARIGSETVVGIGVSAFSNKDLTSVILPDTLQVIYDDAFSFNHLTSIIIPDSVNRIFDHAFADNQLTHVTLSKNITELGAGVFCNNRLNQVNFSVEMIIKNPNLKNQLLQAFDAGVRLDGK